MARRPYGQFRARLRPVNPKKIGTYYESLFKTEVLKRGYNVATPEGDYLGYDVIVEGAKGLKTVQVKGTRSIEKKYMRWKIVVTNLTENIDFLCAYVDWPDLRSWYVIPREKIKCVTVKLYPDRPSSKGVFEPYRNAWHLLGGKLD